MCHRAHMEVRGHHCSNQFSPSTTWVPEMELRFGSKYLYQLSHLTVALGISFNIFLPPLFYRW